MAMQEDAGTEDPKIVRELASRYLDSSIALTRTPAAFATSCGGRSEDCGSEDSHGRSLWALGTLVGRSTDPGCKSLAGQLFESALKAVPAFSSPRAWAYALLGIDGYLRAFRGDTHVQSILKLLSTRLLDLYRRTSQPDVPWFEDRLT
jgi:hypothetical protein